MKLRDVLLPVAALTMSVSAVVVADPLPNVYSEGNLWSITFHDDDSTNHNQWATQRICFSPYASSTSQSQIKGTWYSTSYPNWHGHYRQEGDSVKMVGNFWQGKGNDGITWDIVTSASHTGLGVGLRTIGAGHWHEWGDDGRYGPVYGFGNALFQRVGSCKLLKSITGITAADSKAELIDTIDYDLNIKPRVLSDGSEATHPQQEGQLPLEGANEYESLF